MAQVEMGKLPAEGRAEVDKCARCCGWVAEHAQDALSDQIPDSEGGPAYRLRWQPMGLVLGIMPWNFPYWQVVRMAAAAIAAGNGVLIKHAPSTQGCAKALQDSAEAAGLGAALAVLPISEADTGALIAHPAIAAVSFTGSTAAGASVAAAAGAALKPCLLELGGSDPYLVLDGADLELAADACVAGRFLNSGQSCIAAKRWIVEAAVADAFVEQVLTRVDALDLAPLARKDLRDGLHRQVDASVAAGAQLLRGGHIPQQAGWHYPATVLDHVRPGMAVAEEETFGPVGCVFRVRDREAAVALANATPFGLGAAVFHGDEAVARQIGRRLRAGSIAINGPVVSDPQVPFGGTAASGWGRELGIDGFHAFCHRITEAVHGG
jgi:succinate-semialdehyde dehydrogenase/glutarate-semialdehyde dehydrogenase